MNEKLPANFDWVTARSDCSLPVIFWLLRSEAEKNVEKRNELAGKKRFEYGTGADHFVIMRGSAHSVKFVLKPDHIFIESTESQHPIKATLTLNDLAECKLKVGDQELDRWQLLRSALEGLFVFEG